jgi:hypothetical protein
MDTGMDTPTETNADTDIDTDTLLYMGYFNGQFTKNINTLKAFSFI